MNTIALRISSVISASPTRLAMNLVMFRDGRGAAGRSCDARPMLSGYVRLVEIDLRDRRRIYALHVGLGGGEPVDEVRDHDRRLRQQQGLDLAGDLLLDLQVNGGHILLDELVVGRILEPRGVPGARRGERAGEEHVRDAAAAVVDEAHRAAGSRGPVEGSGLGRTTCGPPRLP